MNDVIMAALCSSVLVALVNQIGNSIQWKRQREAAKQDNKDSRLEALEKGVRSMMLDRLQYLCKAYIKDGVIDVDDRRRLHIMHDCYHALGGNGDLDKLIEQVNELPIK